MTDLVIIPQRFWLRRGVKSDLMLVDEVLFNGEVCFEYDTDFDPDSYRMKVGNGNTPWHALPYIDIKDARELPFDPTGTTLLSTNVYDALVELAGLVGTGGGGGATLATTVTDGDTTHAPDGNAVYDFVTAAIAALSTVPHVPVKYASPGNITIATLADGSIIDPGGGSVAATGDRVLLPNQTDPTENGIYDIAATGPAVRSPDADTGAKLLYAQVYVQSGSHLGGRTFRCTSASPIVLGTTAITWIISSNGAINDTDSLPEGTGNKYFTDERVMDAVAAMFAAGTDLNVTFTYDDAGNRMGVSVPLGTGANTSASGAIAITFGSPAALTALTPGQYVDIPVPKGYTLDGPWQLQAYPSGSITLDVRKATFPSVPTASIITSGGPSVASSTSSSGTIVYTSSALAIGDMLRVYVSACSGVKWFSLLLNGTRT